MKRFKLAPYSDGKTVFLSLEVKDKKEAETKSYSLPLTKAEMAVIQNLLSFSIPRLIGFDRVWGGDNVAWGKAPAPPSPPDWKVLNN